MLQQPSMQDMNLTWIIKFLTTTYNNFTFLYLFFFNQAKKYTRKKGEFHLPVNMATMEYQINCRELETFACKKDEGSFIEK